MIVIFENDCPKCGIRMIRDPGRVRNLGTRLNHIFTHRGMREFYSLDMTVRIHYLDFTSKETVNQVTYRLDDDFIKNAEGMNEKSLNERYTHMRSREAISVSDIPYYYEKNLKELKKLQEKLPSDQSYNRSG